MKSFQEFREQKKGFIRISKRFNKLLNRISKECRPYLKEPNIINKPLLRGSRSRYTDKPWYEKKMRSGREARDSSKILHNILDDYFLDRFGNRYRSNAIFCSIDDDLIVEFGNTHLVFPIGKYNIISSPVIRDLTRNFGTIKLYELISKAYDVPFDVYDKNSILFKDMFEDFPKEPLYKEIDNYAKYKKNVNITDTLGNEIMMEVDRYILVDVHRIFVEIKPDDLVDINLVDIQNHVSGSIRMWNTRYEVFMKLVKGHFNKYLVVE